MYAVDRAATGIGNQAIYSHKYENRTSKLPKATSDVWFNQTCLYHHPRHEVRTSLLHRWLNSTGILVMGCVCRTVREIYQMISKSGTRTAIALLGL
jgi:hypothetical protein